MIDMAMIDTAMIGAVMIAVSLLFAVSALFVLIVNVTFSAIHERSYVQLFCLGIIWWTIIGFVLLVIGMIK